MGGKFPTPIVKEKMNSVQKNAYEYNLYLLEHYGFKSDVVDINPICLSKIKNQIIEYCLDITEDTIMYYMKNRKTQGITMKKKIPRNLLDAAKALSRILKELSFLT
jgi:hypothetical protein